MLATGDDDAGALALAGRFADAAAMDAAIDGVTARWRGWLGGHRIETPDPALDALANDWLRYQAISARLFGRAGYYQQSGAYGFRDQLQDSQVWLTIDPPRCRRRSRSTPPTSSPTAPSTTGGTRSPSRGTSRA